MVAVAVKLSGPSIGSPSCVIRGSTALVHFRASGPVFDRSSRSVSSGRHYRGPAPIAGAGRDGRPLVHPWADLAAGAVRAPVRRHAVREGSGPQSREPLPDGATGAGPDARSASG